MVAYVFDLGWKIEATAVRLQVDPKTVRKWRDQFIAGGADGLWDRRSRPRRPSNRTQRWPRPAQLGLRANSSLGDALASLAESRGDQLSLGRDPRRASSEAAREQLVGLDPGSLPAPSVAEEFAENMRVSDCLPPALALEVARQRLIDLRCPTGDRRNTPRRC
jgi:transposase-like protein